MNWSTFQMNGSVFSKARYMYGVGFEILAYTPVPKLSPLPPTHEVTLVKFSIYTVHMEGERFQTTRDFLRWSSTCAHFFHLVLPRCSCLNAVLFRDFGNWHSVVFQSNYLTKIKRWQLNKKRPAKPLNVGLLCTCRHPHILFFFFYMKFSGIHLQISELSRSLGCIPLTLIICLHCIFSGSGSTMLHQLFMWK